MIDLLKSFDKVLFFYELGGVSIEKSGVSEGSLAIIIGPEGGFSVEEKILAEQNGAVVCTLGKRILRTETAPLAALSAVMTLTGNMD